jgi:hypothetical protein
MKMSTLERNNVSLEVVELISRLVDMIPWPERRAAIGDVTITLLDGKHRAAEDVFGWNRSMVKLGIKESESGITCKNDLSNRQKPKTEDKHPGLVDDIHSIMEPHSQADPGLRTTLLYTNMTARAVYDALIEKGWSKDELPTMRTLSNILNRHGYRLRSVAKTKVQKKQRRPS